MGTFTVIPQNTLSALQLDAGVLLKTFNPASPSAPADSAIICATTGGIQVSCVPTYSDLGEDVDNVPNNMKEFKHLDSWECKLSTTSLGTSADLIKMALGVADVNGTKITPRADLAQSDFSDIWWVGDRADGGWVAVQLKNALSTGGFSLQTTKNGKGQTGIEITGHVSINAQNDVPMVFYSSAPASITITAQPVDVEKAAGTSATFSVTASGTSLSYQWQVLPVGGATYSNISGGTSATLTLSTSDVTVAANGNKYRCIVSDANGSVYTDEATLTVTAGA